MWQVTVYRFLRKLKKNLDRFFGISRVPFIRRMTRYTAQNLVTRLQSDSPDNTSVTVNGVNLLMPKRFYPHYISGEYEPVTTKTFIDSLRAGMTVIDVGAHIGYYSLLAAKRVGETGKVYSVEPCQENLFFLNKNVSLNDMKNIRVYPYAAGGRRGMRNFHITGSSDSHGFYSHPLTDTIETIEIVEMPLDEIIDTPVQAIKIDVEGAELEVLKGMKEILTANKQLHICIEWMPACMINAGYDPLDLPAYLQDLGFNKIQVLDDREKRVRSLDEAQTLIRSGKTPPSWYVNLWARRG